MFQYIAPYFNWDHMCKTQALFRSLATSNPHPKTIVTIDQMNVEDSFRQYGLFKHFTLYALNMLSPNPVMHERVWVSAQILHDATACFFGEAPEECEEDVEISLKELLSQHAVARSNKPRWPYHPLTLPEDHTHSSNPTCKFTS